jgi:histidinol-phosphate aminotransferase
MSVLNLARPELLAFKGYSSARMEAGAGAVFLNANESPWPPFAGDTLALNRYPTPQPQALLDALAQAYGVQATQIFVGRGSDEPIDLLTRAFCRAGVDAVVIMPPTFGMYRVCAGVQGARVIEVPLQSTQNFQIDWDALQDAIDCDQKRTIKLIYFCTPNNPTGGELALAKLQQFALDMKDRALIVIDEAYGEFSAQPSCASWLATMDNIVVLKTLSKAYGLAGARVGCMLAQPQLIQLIRKIMPPYPVPSLVSDAALKVLLTPSLVREKIALLQAERVRVETALQQNASVQYVWPSAANFIAFQCFDSQLIYQRLAHAGVIVRDVSHYFGLSNCLRVSIGTRAENDQFLFALA